MTIYVNNKLKHLLEGATDRQKIWIGFWSYIYHRNECTTWMNLHQKDYQFMLGLKECLYDINAIGSVEAPQDNPTVIRHLGEALAAEFEWRCENRHNVLWRSRTLARLHDGKGQNSYYAEKPLAETKITDPKAINAWCYLLGRLTAGNLVSNFKWRDMGWWTIDELYLDEMGEKAR